MEIRRVVLYAALAFVIYSLWTNWQKDYPLIDNKQSVTPVMQGDAIPSPTHSLSNNDEPLPSIDSNQTSQTRMPAQVIHVKTDVLDLDIDLQHGDVINAKLIDYPQHVNEKNQPFVLLMDTPTERYVANSNLFVLKDNKVENLVTSFNADKKAYQLDANQTELRIKLTANNDQGIEITKEFLFKKGSYLINVGYEVTNHSSELWQAYMNTQLLWSQPKEDKSSVFHMGSYTGASYSNPGHHRYEKVNFKDMTKANLDLPVTGGWIAMQQHYFLTAWVPNVTSENRFYTRANNDEFSIGAVSQLIKLQPNDTKRVAASLYLGPELTDVLKAISPGLDLTADYGWLWFLSLLLLSLMKSVYSVVGNWGWSIVLVTLLIKLAFYRLSATSYRSMANMRKLQPKLQALRERFGDDKAKISQATMELYRQEKVNPLGGCLPILIQIPVFIALYWVLMESVALRQAPFILWINDLAAADPYHVLPVIMGITMLVQQKLNPAPPDPMQAKVMMFLPILFTGILWNSPSGLVLYWTINNSLSILQQWYITKTIGDNVKQVKTLTSIKK